MKNTALYKPNQSVIARVHAKMDAVSRTGDECWEWPMSRTSGGYGQLSTSNGSADTREMHYAHRVAYYIANGPFQSDMNVCHKCDNPSCFNPGHLFLGTAKANVRDCVRKGRFVGNKGYKAGDDHWTRSDVEKRRAALCGGNNSRARLTNGQAAEIRSSSEKGADLARRFGVSPTTISEIRKGKTYRLI